MSSATFTAPQWGNFDNIPSFSPVPHIHMQLLSGEQVMMNRVTIDPGGVVPEHSHPNEQCGFVLEGTLILTLAGETRHLGPGDCYVVPANVPHSGATDHRGCVVMDMFAPPRPDYVAMQEAARAKAGG
ncbi:MAG: cupin domain-containing protein [Chloroflexota bacterium]|nr:cupin domain-containing protein [Chloroflexota bacterium]